MVDYLKELRKRNSTFVKNVQKAVNHAFNQYVEEIMKDSKAVFELKDISEHYIKHILESDVLFNNIEKEFNVKCRIEKVSDDSCFKIVFDKYIKFKNYMSFVFEVSEQFDKYSNIKNVNLSEYKIVNYNFRLDMSSSLLSFSFFDKFRYVIKRNSSHSQIQETFEFRDATRSNMWKNFDQHKEAIKSKEDLSSFLFNHYFIMEDSVSPQIFSSFKYILDFYNSGALISNPDSFEQFLLNRLFQKEITKEEKELLDILFLEKDFAIDKLSQNIKSLDYINNIKKVKTIKNQTNGH